MFTFTAAAPSSMKGMIRPWTDQDPLLLTKTVPGVCSMLGGKYRLALS